MDDIPQLQNAVEVALRLRTTAARVRQLGRRGVLPAVRVGRRLLFDPAQLDRWIESGGRTWPATQS